MILQKNLWQSLCQNGKASGKTSGKPLSKRHSLWQNLCQNCKTRIPSTNIPSLFLPGEAAASKPQWMGQMKRPGSFSTASWHYD